MSEMILHLEGVTRSYRSKASVLEVLKGVDLKVARGEIVGLIAPSGSGKSTLLHGAGLLDRFDQGQFELFGRNARALSDRARTALRRDEIGFVYQFHHLLAELSALENVALPHRATGASSRVAAERAAELLMAVGLGERLGHRPAELSGGEAQRVALCRALVNRPRLLLADEPTGNLDPDTSAAVFKMLLKLLRNTGLATVIATHNLGLTEQMDRAVRLQNGVVVDA